MKYIYIHNQRRYGKLSSYKQINNMTNLENKIKNLKERKEGLSFTKDLKTILKEKYNEIWDDLDDNLLYSMIIDENGDKSVILYFDTINKLTTLPNHRINNAYIDNETKSHNVNICEENTWCCRTLNLEDLLVVTNIDEYIDYQLDKKRESMYDKIESLKKKQENLLEEQEKEDKYAEDAKRFRTYTSNGKIDKSKVDKLRKAEKLRDNYTSIEELAELV